MKAKHTTLYKGFNGVIGGEADENDPLADVRDMLDRFCAEDGSDGEMVEMAAQVLIAATEQALLRSRCRF